MEIKLLNQTRLIEFLGCTHTHIIYVYKAYAQNTNSIELSRWAEGGGIPTVSFIVFRHFAGTYYRYLRRAFFFIKHACKKFTS